MEVGATATTSEPNRKSISINVKFTGKSIPITLPPDSTVKDLKSLLQPLTNVLPRGQKLIFKGRGGRFFSERREQYWILIE